MAAPTLTLNNDEYLQIAIHTYPPHQQSSRPIIPNALIALFLEEVEKEPHSNAPVCSRCHHIYLTGQNGSACTRTMGCLGTLERPWPADAAKLKLWQAILQGR